MIFNFGDTELFRTIHQKLFRANIQNDSSENLEISENVKFEHFGQDRGRQILKISLTNSIKSCIQVENDI